MTTKSPSNSQGLTPEQSLAIGLDYVTMNEGRYIAPIARGRKMPPLFADYRDLASDDPKQIRAWAKKYPGCNWLVSHRKSNLLVVDIDTKLGKSGAATFNDLDNEFGFPPTEENRTPSGGRHLVYQGPHVFALGEGGFGKDIDSPHYSLIPGCVLRDGGVYTSINNLQATPTPKWFYDVLGRVKVKRADTADAVIDLDLPGNVEWAKKFLQRDADPAIEGRTGDARTVNVAMRLRDKGVSEETAFALMLEHYNPRCEPEWQADELRVKVANGFEYASQTAPGEDTAEFEFFPDGLPATITAAEKAARVKKTEERRTKREATAQPETWLSLRDGWVYVGQQRRWVRERDAMMWDPASFDDYFANLAVPDKNNNTPIGKHLLRMKGDTGIRRFETFTYHPGCGRNVDGKLNMYTPSDIVAEKGATALFDAHMAYLFPDQADRDHVLNWLAWFVQNLDKKPKHALIIQGEHQGTGKSWIADMLAEIIGTDNVTPVSQDTFALSHNGWAMHTKLIVCEELRSLGNYVTSKASKMMHEIITQEKIEIDEKNMPPFTLKPFLAGVIGFTNSDKAIRPDDGDRRYLIIKTIAVPKPDAYYAPLFDLLDDPGALGAIKWQLENRPLAEYTGSARAPATAAKQAMTLEASGDLEMWMLDNAENRPLCHSLASVEEVCGMLPKDLEGKGVRGQIADILRRRFNGIKVPSPIRPQGRKGDAVRIWAIGPNAKATAKSTGLVAIWNAERSRAAVEAGDTAADDFAIGSECDAGLLGGDDDGLDRILN